MNTTSIWRPDGRGGRAVRIVPPSAWQGEPDCVLGPFSSRDVARRFAGFGEDFGHFDLRERVFAHRDAWYVAIESLSEIPAATSPDELDDHDEA